MPAGDEKVPAKSLPAKQPEKAPGSESEEAIKRLMEMGFDRDHVVKALSTARNNQQLATEYLLTA